ncbi:MAG: UDP-N-acetylmuramoyl-tripeptide--D-alanyl-D-alanine ligase [Bacteroidota bacterium]|nr:UDP-N-acetylmuramoyl-tripeptide--D-alanyl-D-alanine ligase [Bacteroidota bacterium]
MSLKELYSLFLQHPEISTDSRVIKPGSLFFALKGEHFNGNQYALTALEKGAAFAIIDEPEFKKNDSFIIVENVLKTMQDLATFHRTHFQIPVIAITGTNGKTTTKELMASVLSKKYPTAATPGNLNNHIGVPLTLLSIRKGTGIVITEMGANHPGEIDFLCHIAHPTHGIITNIGRAHLEGFGSFEGIVKTKTELYRYLRDNQGTVFLNGDDTLLSSQAAGLTATRYGFNEKEQVRGTLLKCDPLVNMEVHLGNESIAIHSRLFGDYNATNILAACCIGHFFQVPGQMIKEAIEGFIPSNNRSELKQTSRNLLILDDYNANPSSMEAAIRNFISSPYPSKAVVLGDMLELGKDSDEEHLGILKMLETSGIEKVYLIGPEFTRLNTRREWICFQDSELANIWFKHQPLTGSTVLIKGSRGIKLEQIAEVL